MAAVLSPRGTKSFVFARQSRTGREVRRVKCFVSTLRDKVLLAEFLHVVFISVEKQCPVFLSAETCFVLEILRMQKTLSFS